MRTIKLKSLSLVNFKGVRSQEINFSDQVTVVCGENGISVVFLLKTHKTEINIY